MTRRLSSATRSHTEDSIFLKPDEDPVWLDEPTKVEKIDDGAGIKDVVPDCKDGGQSQGEEVFIHKLYSLVVEIQCWVALFISSQVTVCILLIMIYFCLFAVLLNYKFVFMFNGGAI